MFGLRQLSSERFCIFPSPILHLFRYCSRFRNVLAEESPKTSRGLALFPTMHLIPLLCQSVYIVQVKVSQVIVNPLPINLR